MTVWRKSSRSATETACVEIAHLPGGVAVRDSKNRSGPVLAFPARSAASFLARLKRV
ncbi:DUF397 domain-containing protein [Saccharothrix coeruleofusca]|uniref:DUF397 domain-containing protein n=1 Tax=Saccharothrix coeruleofusca TaxID=33919 RepID=A0A918AN07_9PSEU|nr:DUF397 domain-containing protein [Saccharothrix coeruleofusca]MBP2340773.1 hypothetical protein [Saccharothrix coeruleofusca]GGP59710.1 hypothetical protein GCM10010185_35120 [Saccharothrix coeruleofusca]